MTPPHVCRRARGGTGHALAAWRPGATPGIVGRVRRSCVPDRPMACGARHRTPPGRTPRAPPHRGSPARPEASCHGRPTKQRENPRSCGDPQDEAAARPRSQPARRFGAQPQEVKGDQSPAILGPPWPSEIDQTGVIPRHFRKRDDGPCYRAAQQLGARRSPCRNPLGRRARGFRALSSRR